MDKKKIDYLQVILAISGFIISLFAYVIIPEESNNLWLAFFRDMLPDFGASLFAIILVYILFIRKGIFTKEDESILIQESLSSLHGKVDSVSNNVSQFIDGVGCIEKFDEKFNDFDWESLIVSSNERISIVVYYFDSWIKHNQDHLEKFLEKPNTKIQIVMADYKCETNIEVMKSLFPENDESSLANKVKRTVQKLQIICQSAGVNESRLEVYLYPKPLTYSLQLFDSKNAVLSVFEMFRQGRVVSPVFLMNLSKSENTQKFIDKELNGLITKSRKIDALEEI